MYGISWILLKPHLPPNHHCTDAGTQRGGTFTDCVGNPGTGKLEDDVIIKLLSVDPQNYDDAPLEGIRRLLGQFTGRNIPRGEPLDTSQIGKPEPFQIK